MAILTFKNGGRVAFAILDLTGRRYSQFRGHRSGTHNTQAYISNFNKIGQCVVESSAIQQSTHFPAFFKGRDNRRFSQRWGEGWDPIPTFEKVQVSYRRSRDCFRFVYTAPFISAGESKRTAARNLGQISIILPPPAVFNCCDRRTRFVVI